MATKTKSQAMSNEIPTIKAGKENIKRLTDHEFTKIQLYTANKQRLENLVAKLKTDAELIKNKMTMCDLTKGNLANQQQKISASQLEVEKELDIHHKTYEGGVRTEIRKRLDIPLDKSFSFDPNSLEVTIEG